MMNLPVSISVFEYIRLLTHQCDFPFWNCDHFVDVDFKILIQKLPMPAWSVHREALTSD